ncbi:MAG: response regulator transcription factor [Saprospiraceae bacterium]|nr:response regulator transcription factor [Saprospiraceae bacterium]MCB9311390.1 response regulator transcription factor [Lewinellaceae bacterium]HRW75522.1 response regulator transcription factor [Saprospiraceae bacterium]
MPERILIVDDEPDILEFIAYNLKREGYEVFTASDGGQALQVARECSPNLILLDIMMPVHDGVEVCRQLRAMPEFQKTIIAFLTAREEDYTQIAALDSGGDDFINKPIRPKVLLSRIKALLRRKTEEKEDTDQTALGDDLVIDRMSYQVYLQGVAIDLPRKEFELLQFLASKPGRVFKRDEIYRHVWGPDVIVGNRTIDVHIRKIREKIGSQYIKTVKGIGYRFDF